MIFKRLIHPKFILKKDEIEKMKEKVKNDKNIQKSLNCFLLCNNVNPLIDEGE